jgi:hypothetical protein
MTDHITACRKCASTYFLVRESYVWSAHLNEGVLGCTHVSTSRASPTIDLWPPNSGGNYKRN